MVTVVDAHNFLLDYQTKEGVLDRYALATRHDQRHDTREFG